MDATPQIREDGLSAEDFEIESEATLHSRISQTEIEETVKAKDPQNELRQTGCVKEMPGLDRVLIGQALEE